MSMWCPAVSQQPAPASALKQWLSVQRQLVPKTKGPGGVKKHLKGASQDGYFRVLNKALILDYQRRTEGDDARAELEGVQRVDLRGCHVHKLDEEAILSCVRLRLCNLSGCHLQDVGAFYGSINLLKLDLSNNQVSLLEGKGEGLG